MKDIDDKGPNVAVNTSAKALKKASEDIGNLAMIEMKIDKILKYQKHLRAMAIFRGVISFIFFMIFIVLPIIGSVYLVRYVQENLDLDQVRGQYQEFYETIGDIKDTKDQLGGLKDTLSTGTESLKNLLPGNSN